MRNQIRESRSNDGDDHDNQIKNVPRDCEVMLPQTDQFQNDFRTENTDKDVVQLLKYKYSLKKMYKYIFLLQISFTLSEAS
jgi:hypothetical protein